MFKRQNRFVLILSIVSALLTTTTLAKPAFTASEHVVIGDQIQLFFNDHDPGETKTLLHLPNGLALTYGDIVALGDFYGTPGQPISKSANSKDATALFTTAFTDFSNNPAHTSEVTKLLEVVHTELKLVEDAMKNGGNPTDVYKKTSQDNNRQYNCITGGGCGESTWWLSPGRYLQLANDNFDHFGDNAFYTYSIGHQWALETAVIAGKTKNRTQLELAYAINAFASHFLSDRFASGHLRTPRNALAEKVTPGTVASILARYMHDEENGNTLHVHNQLGNRWLVLGDQYYFDAQNNDNRNAIQNILQTSANEIFTAYYTGVIKTPDLSVLLPQADETENAANLDLSPLFYKDSKTNEVYRRVDTDNIYDKHWTTQWWGWSTLVLLNHQRGGIPFDAQTALVRAGLGDKALQAGLITDKNILQYLKKKKV